MKPIKSLVGLLKKTIGGKAKKYLTDIGAKPGKSLFRSTAVKEMLMKRRAAIKGAVPAALAGAAAVSLGTKEKKKKK